MNYLDIPEYHEDINNCLVNILPTSLAGKTVLITGATGLIGSFLVDVFVQYNRSHADKAALVCLNRDEDRAKSRFSYITEADNVLFVHQDVSQYINLPVQKIDFIIHAASNSDPKSFANNPISTITANTLGTLNILEIAKKHRSKVVFLSSREVYGIIQNKEAYTESDYGCIDFNQMRSAYPESKRVGELLCRGYTFEYGIDISIIRLGYVYGPTRTNTDTKVIAQFLNNAINCENIILKSDGKQRRTYIYVADAVNGIITVLFSKKSSGETYNLADLDSIISISDLADIIAEAGKVKKVSQLPTANEIKGWSKAQDVILNCNKLISLGWYPVTNIRQGIVKTITILKQLHISSKDG
jgi:nucleoside-diphosphate-sugar epimerase